MEYVDKVSIWNTLLPIFQLWYCIIAFFRTYNSWLVNTETLLEKGLYKIVSSQQQCTVWNVSHSKCTWGTQHSVTIHGDKKICQFITWPIYWKIGYQHRFCIFSDVLAKLINQRHCFIKFFHPNAICHGIYRTVDSPLSVVESWCNFNIKFWHFKSNYVVGSSWLELIPLIPRYKPSTSTWDHTLKALTSRWMLD